MAGPGETTPKAKTAKPTPEPNGFLVVGLGASAGGLQALKTFFDNLPAPSGLAFVVVTHQHPDHTSLMPDLLARHTALPVAEAVDRARVEPDHVYVAPPGHHLAIRQGRLHLVQPESRAALPIDFFFRSLALDQREQAVGIILSGTGSDGTRGLEELKAAAGMTMAQDEASALYPGMPHSAIAARLVDFVLPVEELPARLIDYAGQPRPTDTPSLEDREAEAFRAILAQLRARTGQDFSAYKASTVGRRIERRIGLHHLPSASAYVTFLEEHPVEVEALFAEMLIGVTSFFRDPEAYEALTKPLEELITSRPDEHVLRVWVPGCSTGEEAYSLAILIRECLDRLERRLDVQIFATDLDPQAIDIARGGLYPHGISGDVSPERLDRRFHKEDRGYRVSKEIREMLIFAPQNVIADPPFTKLDLVSCRNLLIYLDSKLQRRLLPLFHYTLRPGGLLFLGSSETIGSSERLFSTLHQRWKLYGRREVAPGAYAAHFPAAVAEGTTPAQRGPSGPRRTRPPGLAQLADNLLLRELVPPSAIVQERGDIVHIHGRTGMFLEPAPGPQTVANVFNMAREGLQIELSGAMRRAATTDEEILQSGVRVRANGGFVQVDLRVRRLVEPIAFRGLFLVTFDRLRPDRPEPELPAADEAAPSGQLVDLQEQLRHSRSSHQSTTEELETANEELKSTNEELQSTNEELQSANEELETSKEEMQSLNEELQTVNAELQGKVDELSHTNDDMRNLLNGTDIATVFLDNQLNIKGFTEQATRVIRLIPTDVGRPISDLVSRLHYEQLADDAREVLRTLVFREIEVGDREGAWFLVRILPYRTTDNVIDGLVMTFVDITMVKGLRENERRLSTALIESPMSVAGQDLQLHYTWAFGRVLGHLAADVLGKTDEVLLPPEVAEQARSFKQQVLETETAGRQELCVERGGARAIYDLYVEPQRTEDGRVVGVACVATDITARP